MKDVLIVSEDPVGIMEILLKGITSYTDYTYDYIDHYSIKRSFRYKNFGHRTRNFFLKNFRGRNLKREHYNYYVEEAIKTVQPNYKKILVIRPDLLTDHHLQLLRELSDCFIAYYWDTVSFFPRKQAITKYFDKIFSFDPIDCEKYGFDFQSNFYYYESQNTKTEYQVYNLSSMDARRDTIESIASELERIGISYLFKGFSDKNFQSQYIQHTERMTYQHMIKETSRSNVVLDVTKKGQNGLTFRPFEALGLNKKLITTNADIRNYDFYDPNNVLIVNPNKIKLEKSFFERPFTEMPHALKEKHHLKQWLSNVLCG